MHRNIKLIALFNFFTDFHLFSAILIIYFAQVTGSYALGMSLFSVTMVSSALFEIPTGIFSDYIGRKKTMILGAVCAVLAITFYAIGGGYWILFIGALFEGLQRAWYSGNNDALLYETLTDSDKKDDYDHYLGKTGAMFQVASIVGILLGGFVAVYSFQLVMWLSVIPQIICLIISFYIVEPIMHSPKSANIYSHLFSATKKIWMNRKLKLLSITSIVNTAVGESTFQFRSVFVNTLWPIWAVGFSTVLSNIGSALSHWYSGKLIKKFGAFRLMLIASIYGKIINIGAVAVATIVSPILLSTTSLFHGTNTVARSKLMQKEFTDEQRSTLGSINSFMGSLAFGIFAVLLGIFADKFGSMKALLFAYIISLPTVFLHWNLFKGNRDE